MDLKHVCGNVNKRFSLAGRLIIANGLMAMLGLAGCGGGGNDNVAVQVQVPVQPVMIDVPSAWVTPTYTLDTGGGAVAFPQSEYDDGNFILRSSASTTDSALLGSSHTAMPSPVRVVQDSVGYGVLFQHETGDSVPQNVDTPVQTGEVVNSDRALDIAVTAWTVTPAFLHNGGDFPVSEYDDGVFYLQPTTGGERIVIGNSHDVSPDAVQVMQGSYDVIYSLETGGDLVPNNQDAVVSSGVVINSDIDPFNVNVQSVRFQFDATLDGAPFAGNQYQKAVFFLRNTTTGDRVDLGAFYDLPATLFVVAGTYDIVYQYVQGDALPINTDAVVAKAVDISSNPSPSIDISSVAITPAFTLDGGAFPQNEYNDANFYLRGASNTQDVMFLGASEATPVAVRVISSDMNTDVGGGMIAFGNYDVLYRHETGTAVPQNTNAVVLENQLLNMDGGLAVDVPTVDVAGVFTLNGNNFPGDASDSVQFLLRDSGNDSDEFLFGFSDISNQAVKIIPGTYNVVMDHLDGDGVPKNEMHEVAFNKVLNTSQTLNVNVPAVRVDPSFTLDGQAFPASFYQSATFYLRETHAPYNRIFLGKSYKNNDPVMVIKEDYDVIYEHLYGEQTPQNTDKFLETIDL